MGETSALLVVATRVYQLNLNASITNVPPREFGKRIAKGKAADGAKAFYT